MSHKSMDEEIRKLAEMEDKARLGGGADKLEQQRKMGKMTARERIEYFLDPGSFVELNMLAEHQCNDFGMEKKRFLGDGVVTGYGTVYGRKVFIYSEDATVLGGSTGKVHGAKIHYILRLAREMMVPVVCLNDSGGARIQEGMDNVYGITQIFYQNVMNSGVIPQIAAIMGDCTGGSAYSAALCDFMLQVEKTAHVFITGPAVIKEVTGEEVSFEDLGGAKVHSTRSGVVHFTANNDHVCLDLIKRLLSFLPQNNQESPPSEPPTDPVDRETPELLEIVPTDMKKSYDMKRVIKAIVDRVDFFEVSADYAKNIIIGFARMGGKVVGLVANQPQVFAGCIDIDASDKSSRFIRTCDAFNIPLVTLVDVPGFLPGTNQEYGGIIRHGAKMLYAWSEATVPKISCIIRKMYGGSIPAMGVHQIGFDQVFAWPSAEMQMVGAEAAVQVLYGKELKTVKDPDKFLMEKVREYQETYLTPYHSASRSVIDAVIHPKDTRRRMISALSILETKKEMGRAWRKHGNMPT
ncbi:MAG TPA: acyl-CoA carboxylase subunit beta [Thermodesulfobacteriota bacterium]|nr:acyl-CoA carboxylase subunit beta [Thermodesulfobacteriota bacterium]